MHKLIELSIRGSRYYLLANIEERKMEELKIYATQFYSQNPWCANASDQSIAQALLLALRNDIDIHINLKRVDSVLVIK